jgi:hypothetical protein
MEVNLLHSAAQIDRMLGCWLAQIVHPPMSAATSAMTTQSIMFRYLDVMGTLWGSFGVPFAIRYGVSVAGFRVPIHCRLIQIKKASVKRSPSAIKIHASLLRLRRSI